VAHEPVKVKIGTRESKLALWQTEWVVSQLAAAHPGREFELVHIRTKGDKILDSPLAAIGDRGLFVKEIEEALLSHTVDLAVHSLKDVPTELREGLVIAAVTHREDPRDCLLSRRHACFADLPEGAKLGTSSLRRVAQLKAVRPDLEFVSLRGNLDTRLRKLDELGLDGIVLAAAGLERLGWTELVVERLSPELCLPAVGQGALTIETRAQDVETRALVGTLADAGTAACVAAERAFLATLEGGCQVPIGALAVLDGDECWLRGAVASLEGRQLLRGERRGPAAGAETLGRDLGEDLLARGGREILTAIRAEGESGQ
jgi:hydroxymethylbilane synthase